jgi:glycosyl transferase, family 25
MRRPVSVFLINLDRDPERLQAMAQQLNRIGLAFERFPAILGTAMPDYLKRYFLNADGTIASDLKLGEVGVYASHLHIHHQVIAQDLRAALVFEDDLEFSDDFVDVLERALDYPLDWDLIRLSNPAKRSVVSVGQLRDGYDMVKYARIPNNAGAYLISREGAEKFTRWTGVRQYPLDIDMRRGWQFDMRTYGILPPPARANIGASTIDSMEDRGYGRESPVRKALFRITTGRTEFGFAMFRRIAYNIRFLGWRNWLRCTGADYRAAITKRFRRRTKHSNGKSKPQST